ncbi:hypothetical protein [Synechococcus sp. UW105]|jgi:hypothetical protein|uniref:hypothetical protein n=1 Tax=Synechococcus sp. UW105 TaxID=337067 RepID=UPI000C936E61|nr:hypothetical protein [Synechococcus sp. UW105]MAS27052.1 hypothetical protein [Synechococcus sp. NAT40]RZO15313.1 MAG: hypothetical protein EVB08_00730 [Synechococcus sp. MED-G135]
MPLLRFLLLPFRAPLVLLLFGVATVMGHHWTVFQQELIQGEGLDPQIYWTVEVVQSLVVVIICTMPDLLLRQISMLMASSRVFSLVVTLLLVITGGLYVLQLKLLADVLILASAVLLARLDLTRIRVVPPPVVMAFWMAMIVLAGIWLGHSLPSPLWPLAASASISF